MNFTHSNVWIIRYYRFYHWKVLHLAFQTFPRIIAPTLGLFGAIWVGWRIYLEPILFCCFAFVSHSVLQKNQLCFVVNENSVCFTIIFPNCQLCLANSNLFFVIFNLHLSINCLKVYENYTFSMLKKRQFINTCILFLCTDP